MKKNIFVFLAFTSSVLFLFNGKEVNALTSNSLSKDDTLSYYLENISPDDYYIDENGNFVYSDLYKETMEIKNKQLNKSLEKYNRTKKYNISDTLSLNKLTSVDVSNANSTNGFCCTDRNLGIQYFTQERGYYCGPASVKEVLHFLNGSSLSQSTYASNMGTNSSGTMVYRVRNELNARQSRHVYQYEDISTETRFNQILIADVMDSDAGVPFVLHALTSSLYLYNGNELHHYLVVDGGKMNTQQVRYADSWGTDYGRGTTLGKHIDSRANVASTVTSSGRYVIW